MVLRSIPCGLILEPWQSQVTDHFIKYGRALHFYKKQPFHFGPHVMSDQLWRTIGYLLCYFIPLITISPFLKLAVFSSHIFPCSNILVLAFFQNSHSQSSIFVFARPINFLFEGLSFSCLAKSFNSWKMIPLNQN